MESRLRKLPSFIVKTIGTLCASPPDELEEIKVIVQNNKRHFEMAFTSHRENQHENYQILEFLGDSVIFSFITWYLYRRFPQFQESKSLGIITRLKGTLISKKSLAQAAHELGFENFLNMNITTDFNKDAFLEDVFEAFIGAVNLAFDNHYGTVGAGYSVCYRILKGIFDKQDIPVSYDSIIDPKSLLKELIDAHPELGVLEYIQEFSPELMSRLFLNKVEIGVGYGKNKKIQQPIAAKQGLEYIKNKYGIVPSGNKFAQKYTKI